MIAQYKEGRLPDYNGGQPPNPRDFPHKGPMHDEGSADQTTLPHASVTSYGAQVASQHCPILRTGIGIVSKLIKYTSWQSSKTKKMEVESSFKNWGNFDRKTHPILTLNLRKRLS